MFVPRFVLVAALATSFLAPAARAQTLVWNTQILASGSSYVGDTSHAYFGGWLPAATWYDQGTGQLKFAYHDLLGWKYETIDDGNSDNPHHNVGLHNDLIVDGNGVPHVAYYDSNDSALKYAKRISPGVWQTEFVDNKFDGTDVGLSCSIAVSTFFKSPHISYIDATNSQLRHATRFGSLPWVITKLDPGTSVGGQTSIAIGGPGVEVTHISYHALGAKNLKYAYWKDGLWNWGTVDSTGDVGFQNSIAADADGRAHIAYRDKTNKRLKYAVSNPAVVGGFAISVVDTVGDPQESSISVTPDGVPHIAYRRNETQDLVYAVRKYNGIWYYWSKEVVATAGSTGHSPSIALNSTGGPSIAYRREATERVYVSFGQ